MNETGRPQRMLVSDEDVLKLLADIAVHDALAAALAEEVFRQRRDQGGDVTDWIGQLQMARLSLLGSFGRTRLAFTAADELGMRLAPEPPDATPELPTRKRSLLDDPLVSPTRKRSLLDGPPGLLDA